MAFWKKLFGRKKQKEQVAEAWEEIDYDRENVDFGDSEQRSRYITGCLEQLDEASREVSQLTGE